MQLSLNDLSWQPTYVLPALACPRNLQAADTVILFDSDWNPQSEPGPSRYMPFPISRVRVPNSARALGILSERRVNQGKGRNLISL